MPSGLARLTKRTSPFFLRAALLWACLSGSGSVWAQSAELPIVQLFTEDFAPYSMTVDGSTFAASADQIDGYSVEIVKQLFARAGINYTLELVPWKRAYDSALQFENSGVFSTLRNEDREGLFRWVSPLMQVRWAFVTRADREIVISSLESAKQYRVGGYNEDAVAEFLEQQDIAIDYVANDTLNIRKLGRGRIDLWPVLQPHGRWLADREGIAVKEVLTFNTSEMGIAMNPDSDPEILRRLQSELARMHEDGTILQVRSKYFGVD